MTIDCTVKISGEAGQGIQTVGGILANVCHRAGFYVMAINDFESRIRGGITFVQLRISDHPIRAPHHAVDLLIALDAETCTHFKDEVVADGVVIAADTDTPGDAGVHRVAFEQLAVEAGGRIMANTVAAGLVLALLGAPIELLKEDLKARFGAKKQAVLESNLSAAEMGYGEAAKIAFKGALDWQPGAAKGRLMEGAEAIALGALAADCRFAAFYPMSPATGILTNMVKHGDGLPLVVEQAEDEIAAVNMTTGASFAGVRALTATSGGGFSLMVEGLGLAAITETPLVIIDAQRPGPATGLPTRTAQADLLFAIHASQDEFPRFVFAPRSMDEAFAIMARAFHLTQKYQVPAIVMVDQFLNDSWFVSAEPFRLPDAIECFTVSDADLPDPASYRRFEVTDDGISPRALPCKGRALVKACSDEHTPDGHMTEVAAERVRMVNKRAAKWPAMRAEMAPPRVLHGKSKTLLVGWGSTEGALYEAVARLRADGQGVGCASFNDLWPFPAEAVSAALGEAERFIMVEQNGTAQLGQLIRGQTGMTAAGAILKYDGRPFFPQDICDGYYSQQG